MTQAAHITQRNTHTRLRRIRRNWVKDLLRLNTFSMYHHYLCDLQRLSHQFPSLSLHQVLLTAQRQDLLSLGLHSMHCHSVGQSSKVCDQSQHRTFRSLVIRMFPTRYQTKPPENELFLSMCQMMHHCSCIIPKKFERFPHGTTRIRAVQKGLNIPHMRPF